MRNPILVAGLVCGAAAGFAIASMPAAQAQPSPVTDQVRVVYDAPKNPKSQVMRTLMQERRIFEVARDILNAFRMPRELILEAKGCDGAVEAFYEDGRATICDEYVELIEQHAPKLATPGGVLRDDAIVGAILDTLFHEAGHAVFDLLKIPIVGREEDAADFFSAFMLLQFPEEDAHRLIQGVGFMMASEARDALRQQMPLKTYAKVHGLPAQRYYNLLCMGYGAYPATFRQAISRGLLPMERAEGCAEEYATFKFAFARLILPHVDEKRFRAAIAQVRFNWSPLGKDRERFDKPPLDVRP